MYLNTGIFLTTGYARVLLLMFIRRELGGTVQDVYFSLHTVTECVVKEQYHIVLQENNTFCWNLKIRLEVFLIDSCSPDLVVKESD